MSQYKTEQDAQIHHAALSTTLGYGSASDPVGWFCPAQFGDRWIIVHESNEGFVTVMDFDTKEKRDAHVQRLRILSRLSTAGVTDDQFIDCLHGYRTALAEAFEFDGTDEWTVASQDGTRRAVVDFVTAHADDIRTYIDVLHQSWGEVGALWAHAVLGEGESFDLYAGGEAVDRILAVIPDKPRVIRTDEGLDIVS